MANVDAFVLDILVFRFLFFVGTAETKVIIEYLLSHLMSCSIELLQKLVMIIKNPNNGPSVDQLMESFFTS